MTRLIKSVERVKVIDRIIFNNRVKYTLNTTHQYTSLPLGMHVCLSFIFYCMYCLSMATETLDHKHIFFSDPKRAVFTHIVLQADGENSNKQTNFPSFHADESEKE